jgi:hypothetical protein
MVPRCPETVVPKKTQTSCNTVEGPNDESRPNIVTEATKESEALSVFLLSIRRHNLLELARVKEATDEKDSVGFEVSV